MKKCCALLLALVLGCAALPAGGLAEEPEPGHINIYITMGTLPTLYALLNAYQDEAPSYMWYLRGGTADTAKLPEHVTIMKPVTPTQEYSADDTRFFIQYVADLYAANPDKQFHLYVDDLRVQFELLLLIHNGIPQKQYTVTLLSDGTGSYSYFNQRFADAENPLGEWATYTNWYQSVVKKAREEGVIDDYEALLEQNMRYAYMACPASVQEHFEYWMQWPELMRCGDEAANEKFSEMNKVKKMPYELYAALPEEKKAAFLNAVGLDKTQWDTDYFPEGGKYMIISGTSAAGEKNAAGESNFEEMVTNLMREFGDSYTYYYKPHPSWPASTVPGRAAFLAEKGIREMPAQLPMECIIWAYPGVKIGGYSSSLYMSATEGQVAFFFSDGPQYLAAPLPDLYALGVYNGSRFYAVNSKNLSGEGGFALSSVEQTANEDGTRDIEVHYTSGGEIPLVYLACYAEDGQMEQMFRAQAGVDGARVAGIPAQRLTQNVKLLIWTQGGVPCTYALTQENLH